MGLLGRIRMKRISFPLGRWVARKWQEILLVTALGTFFMGYLAVGIRIDTDLTLLLPQRDPYFLQYNQFFEEGNVDESLIMVFEAPNNRIKALEMANEVYLSLSQMVDYVSYFRKMDAVAMMGPSGIILSNDQVFQRLWSTVNLAKLLIDNPAVADFAMIRVMGNSLHQVQEVLDQLASAESIDNYVLFSQDHQLMIMNILLTQPSMDQDFIASALRTIRTKVDTIVEAYGVTYSFTGSYQSSYDSFASINQDFLRTTMITLSLITLLFFLIYGNIWITIGIFLSLVVAGICSIGSLTLIFGHLNVTSSFILAALLGLGIDFGIHISNRIIEEMKTKGFTDLGHSKEQKRSIAKDSIVLALNSTGKTTMIGGLTTATAFLSLLVVDSPALMEMGAIIAFGIIIFLATMLLVLPPLLILFSPWMRLHSFRRHLSKHLFRIYRPFSGKGSKFAIYGILILTGVMSVFAVRTFQNFDFTPPPLIPQDTESQKTLSRLVDKKMVSQFEDSVVTFFEDPAKLMAAHQTFVERSRYIQDVHSIIDYIPPFLMDDFPQFKQQISTIKQTISNPLIDVLLRKHDIDKEIHAFFEIIDSSDSFRTFMDHVFQSNILPVEAQSFFVSRQDDRILYKVYIEANAPLFTDNHLKSFVEEIETFGVNFFGYSILFYKVTQQVISAIMFALLLASVIICITIIIVLRTVGDTVIILSSLAITLILLYAVVGLLGLGINYMTLLSLPLIVGIGIDGSIHIISRFKEEQKNGNSIHSVSFFSRTFLGTGKAVILSGMTTMIAFLSFLAARSPILQNMGLVLALGIIINLFLSLCWVPSWKLMQDKWRKGAINHADRNDD